MRTLWKAALAGLVCEATAFGLLWFGRPPILGPGNLAGEVGLYLHLPGLLVLDRLPVRAVLGSYEWVVGIGVCLSLWVGLWLVVLKLIAACRRLRHPP